jgi:Secretion system C-terminal sorting domain
MKAIIFAILLQLLFLVEIKAQFEDYYWVSGQHAAIRFDTFSPFAPSPVTGLIYDYSSSTNASICNRLTGELLFYSSGSRILNKLGQLMQNGDSINQGKYQQLFYPFGINVFDAMLTLPLIYNNDKYFVFYTNLDSFVSGQYVPTKLYYSIVDMSYNNGLGKVIQKDVTVLNHLLEPGRLNAIHHANGRDWWLVVNGFMDTQHFIYLVDYTGIHLVHTQTIGTPFISTIHRDYQCVVNQSGTQLAYLYSTLDNMPNLMNRIDLYDFDRCAGTLSNYKTISFIDSTTLNGVAFSPNDSLLYVNGYGVLYQYNLKDVQDSIRMTVGRYDSVYNPFQTVFNMEKLGPDGKIYVSTWGGTRSLHCITNPNIRGSACNFVQGYLHTDSSNHYFSSSLPNYPNFHLGALVGSACDTVGVVPLLNSTNRLQVYPNPANELLYVSNINSNDQIEVFNILGNKKAITFINRSANSIIIAIEKLPIGIYLLKVTAPNGQKQSVKWVKE